MEIGEGKRLAPEAVFSVLPASFAAEGEHCTLPTELAELPSETLEGVKEGTQTFPFVSGFSQAQASRLQPLQVPQKGKQS